MIKVVKQGTVLPLIIFFASAVFIISILIILDNHSKAKEQNLSPVSSQSLADEADYKEATESVITEASRSANTDDVSTNWKTYTNSKFGYVFQYPADWNYLETQSRPERILISSPRFKGDGGSPVLVNVYVYETDNLKAKLGKDWQESFKPYDELETVVYGDKTFILRAGSYLDGVGISQKRTNLAKEIFPIILSTFKFTK